MWRKREFRRNIYRVGKEKKELVKRFKLEEIFLNRWFLVNFNKYCWDVKCFEDWEVFIIFINFMIIGDINRNN